MKRIATNPGLLSRLILLCALLAFLGLATGCDSAGEGADAVAISEVALEPTAVIATATTPATAEPEPEVVAMATETEPDTCTDCHTDQDLLIDTADPVEEVVSENEGEG